ncbi:MAG: PepSY domain-containing protein, partial [bacterium]
MTLSIWRFSHFILAFMASVFILLASITGIVLAVEPIQDGLSAYQLESDANVSLAHALSELQKTNKEIYALESAKFNLYAVSAVDKDSKQGNYYFNPVNGNKLVEVPERKQFYNFITNLHRSLFLKSTGRILITIASFFLVLIVITGLFLMKERQGGWRKLFGKIIKEKTLQYNHVILGRYLFLPLLIIAVSGIYISLEKFDIFKEPKVELNFNSEIDNTTKSQVIADFPIFQNTSLDEVVRLDFPFSDDPSDYFELKLDDKVLLIHQYNGQIIDEHYRGVLPKLSKLNVLLHTGQGSLIWSLVLLLSSCSLVYFIYSGLRMYFQRKSNATKSVNTVEIEEAEFLILVGSETGTTFKAAQKFHQAIINKNKKSYIIELNNFKGVSHSCNVVVFTATYGEGEAPTNARNFISQLEENKSKSSVQYSVVGFGSLLYPDYCQFAIDVAAKLKALDNYQEAIPLHKINNRSNESFKHWLGLFNAKYDLDISLSLDKVKSKPRKLQKFEVIKKHFLKVDDTFTLVLKPIGKKKFYSGDLLAFYPDEDPQERLYSIAKVDNHILLSIRRHEKGICSNYLANVEVSEIISGKIKSNYEFNFPNYAKEIITISNGTGLAPFLGILDENSAQIPIHLFWGGRRKESYSLYKKYVDSAREEGKVASTHLTYSQEASKQYVQDLIKENKDMIIQSLQNEGVIMICGSIAMQNDTLEVLENICKNELQTTLST